MHAEHHRWVTVPRWLDVRDGIILVNPRWWVTVTHWSQWSPRVRAGVVVVVVIALAALTVAALLYVLLGPRMHGGA